jgi:hypothetical protein
MDQQTAWFQLRTIAHGTFMACQQFSFWRRLKTLSENFVGHFVEKSDISQNASTKRADKVGDEDT